MDEVVGHWCNNRWGWGRRRIKVTRDASGYLVEYFRGLDDPVEYRHGGPRATAARVAWVKRQAGETEWKDIL